MSVVASERRGNLTPALVAAALLHAGLFAAFLIYAPKGDRQMLVSSVPVTIVSDAPATAPEDTPFVAESAPEQLTVQPEDAAPPPPPPAPAPPVPTPKPTPSPKPIKPPPKARPTPQVDPNWMDNVADGPAAPRRPGSRPHVDAPPKKENHVGGAPNRGALSQTGKASLALIANQVARNWLLDCAASNLDEINPVLRFQLNDRGELVGTPQYVGGDPTPNHAQANRAIAAMQQTQPFGDVTDDLIGRTLQLKFPAAKACRSR